MSAIPSNLYIAPKVKGLKSVKSVNISLRPVNASSASIFEPLNGQNIISFHIPAYPNSFISPKSTFLSMIVKAVQNVGTENFRMSPGYPMFERLQIKTSSGLIIVDIDDYNILQKLHQNLDPDHHGQGALIGDYRAKSYYDSEAFADSDELLFNSTGVSIQHNILAGIFSTEHYIPVGLFSGSAGHSLEINLYLTKPHMCMNGRSSADTSGATYNISNCILQLELVQLPESINQKLNDQLMRGDKVSIPMVNYRSHKSFIPTNSKSVDITISESAHDLEAVMTVLLPNAQISNPVHQIYGNEVNTAFLGGRSVSGSNKKVAEYQFNYGDTYYPAQKVELKTADQRVALMHLVKQLDLTGKAPYIIDKPTEWVDQFCIVQSFKSSKEDDFENGLNSSSSGTPLILHLALDNPLVNVSYRVISFVKQNQTLNIFKGGYTSITDGMVSSE